MELSPKITPVDRIVTIHVSSAGSEAEPARPPTAGYVMVISCKNDGVPWVLRPPFVIDGGLTPCFPFCGHNSQQIWVPPLFFLLLVLLSVLWRQ